MSSLDSEESWDEEGWEDNECALYRCFFANKEFETPLKALLYDQNVTDGAFDFLDWIESLQLDTYSVIQLINYLRTFERTRESGIRFCQEIQRDKHRRIWEDEKYMIPTDPTDPMLTVDFHHLAKEKRDPKAFENTSESSSERGELEALRIENLKLKQELEWWKLTKDARDGIQSILQSNPEPSDAREGNQSIPESNPEPFYARQHISDRAYFASYGSEAIHREMLQDTVRTDGYQKAIESHRSFFEGKVVLDLGCGTGILSLMACKAGAKAVYAVDASGWATAMTRQIAKENGFQDRIHVLHGRIEDLEDTKSVDVIISEWMGYALLFESMLDSVLYARDHWLKPSGVVLPNKAKIFAAGASELAFDVEFWKDVFGFKMTTIVKDIIDKAQRTPLVHSVSAEALLTEPMLLKVFDLKRMTPDDIDFTTEFVLKRTQKDSSAISAIVIWFEVEFSEASNVSSVTIDTSPYQTSTHWGQTVLALNRFISDDIHAQMHFSRNLETRSLSISTQIHPSLSNPFLQTLHASMDIL